jgi:diadenosine tetraphosphatase ApaH/serine/threonine PP2A family protein phosphatase
MGHIFVGHVHYQTLYYQGSGRGLMQFLPTSGVAIPVQNHRQWVATVGSIGQPRDGDTRAMYAIYNQEEQRLTFFRIPYDFSASAMAIRNAGLPEFLAKRLEVGK